METLNKVILRGRVGAIKVNEYNGVKMARLSLQTQEIFKANGNLVIESTWHNVSVWEKEGMPKLDTIKGGDALYIEGRFRCIKGTKANGEECMNYEVMAQDLQMVEE